MSPNRFSRASPTDSSQACEQSSLQTYRRLGGRAEDYSLPEGILAYYSPTYFAPMLRGDWKEQKDGLQLPNENPKFFGVLLDYFRIDRAELKLDSDLKLDNIAIEWHPALVECFGFIKITHYYDVIEAASAVQSILWDIFNSRHFDNCVAAVSPKEMQSCLGKLPPDNIILKVIASVCVQVLAGSGPQTVDMAYLLNDVPDSENITKELIRKNHNLAVAMWEETLNRGEGPGGSGWKGAAFKLQQQDKKKRPHPGSTNQLRVKTIETLLADRFGEASLPVHRCMCSDALLGC